MARRRSRGGARGSKGARSEHGGGAPRLREPSIEAVYLVETGEMIPGDAALHREILRVRAELYALEARERLLVDVAKARTGDADGVRGLWAWSPPKSGKGRTAWAKVCAELDVPPELIAKHTKPAKAFRMVGAPPRWTDQPVRLDEPGDGDTVP